MAEEETRATVVTSNPPHCAQEIVDLICPEETEANSVNPVHLAYALEVEVNENGETENETTGTQANGVSVPVPDAQQTGLHVFMPNSVDRSKTNVEEQFSETITSTVSDHAETVIFVVQPNGGELSEKDIEAIKQQVANQTETVTTLETNVPNTVTVASCENTPSTEQIGQKTSTEQNANSGAPTHTCYQCKAEFPSSSELVYHFVQAHSNSVKCQHCEKVFPSIATANKHKKQRHQEIVCTICGKICYGKEDLKSHVKLHNNKCGTCFKSFTSKKDMDEHIEREHKVHKCFLCGRGFYFETSLLNHFEGEHHVNTVYNDVNVENDASAHHTVVLSAVVEDGPSAPVVNVIEPNAPTPEEPTPREPAPPPVPLNAVTLEDEKSPVQEVNSSPVDTVHKSPRKRSQNETVPEEEPCSPQEKKPATLACEECNATVIDAEAASLLTTSPTCHDRILCKQCEVDLKNSHAYESYTKSKHEVPADQLVCSYCKKEFKTKRNFDVHIKDNWKRCPVAVSCELCSKVLNSTRQLNSHLRRDHKGQREPKT